MAKARTPAKFKAVVPILDIFRILAAEFASVEDPTVLQWIDLTTPMVSRKQFGNLYEQAVALLAAHRMKVSGSFDETADGEGGGGMGGIAAGLRVASYSEGSTSVSFNNSVSMLEDEAELTLTAYGTQYRTLMRRVIVPIMSSGEAR